MKISKSSRYTPVLHADNMAAMTLAKFSALTQRSNYVDMRYYYIQDLVATKKLRTAHYNTHVLQTDALTKPLA